MHVGQVQMNGIETKTPACSVVVLFCFTLIQTGYAQDREPYYDQDPPGLLPEVFLPDIFSESNYREYVYNILPDGSACVFDRHADYGFPQGEIFISKKTGGQWSEPELYPLFEDIDDVFLPTISPDGTRWFFTSTSIPLPAGETGAIPLFYIEKTESGWTQPVYLGQHIHAAATVDGTIYLMEEGRGPALRRLIDGEYGVYEYLQPTEYFREDDAHFVVDPFERFLIFDSQSRPGIGECRLFISYKQHDGFWTEPLSMGEFIRQRAGLAWISYDGQYLFYKAGDDVYWVSTAIVERMKPQC